MPRAMCRPSSPRPLTSPCSRPTAHRRCTSRRCRALNRVRRSPSGRRPPMSGPRRPQGRRTARVPGVGRSPAQGLPRDGRSGPTRRPPRPARRRIVPSATGSRRVARRTAPGRTPPEERPLRRVRRWSERRWPPPTSRARPLPRLHRRSRHRGGRTARSFRRSGAARRPRRGDGLCGASATGRPSPPRRSPSMFGGRRGTTPPGIAADRPAESDRRRVVPARRARRHPSCRRPPSRMLAGAGLRAGIGVGRFRSIDDSARPLLELSADPLQS